MAKNLMKKSLAIQLPEVSPIPIQEAPIPSKPKTAPGTLMGFMETQSAAHQENKVLRKQLEEAEEVAGRFAGASPVRSMDPRTIRRSEWANRNAVSFEGAEWTAFKEDIRSNGGNETPIRVRPLAAPAGDVDFEIIYGHRRHQACLELGIPVRAQIEDASEHKMFVAMELENRSRKDLSAWEQGVFYAKALDKGLYPSARKLAEAIHRDLSDVGKALALSRLPEVVIAAFASPLDLQFRWAKPLTDANQADPEGLLARAKSIVASGRRESGSEVLAKLVGQNAGVAKDAQLSGELEIGKNGKGAAAVLSSDKKGRPVLKFRVVLPEEKRRALVDYVAKLLVE